MKDSNNIFKSGGYHGAECTEGFVEDVADQEDCSTDKLPGAHIDKSAVKINREIIATQYLFDRLLCCKVMFVSLSG
jgi:hypothetical protein